MSAHVWRVRYGYFCSYGIDANYWHISAQTALGLFREGALRFTDFANAQEPPRGTPFTPFVQVRFSFNGAPIVARIFKDPVNDLEIYDTSQLDERALRRAG